MRQMAKTMTTAGGRTRSDQKFWLSRESYAHLSSIFRLSPLLLVCLLVIKIGILLALVIIIDFIVVEHLSFSWKSR